MNQLYNQYGNGPYKGMMDGFKEFAKTVKGDPQQQVQQLLNSGRISQAQYNAAVQKANMIRGILGV